METVVPRRLTVKRMKWIKDVIENGEPVNATKRVFNVGSNDSAISMTEHLLKDENVMAEVRLALNVNGITPDWIVEQHKKLALSSENDMVKTKNLEDLGEMRGMYPKKNGAAVDVSREGIRIEWGGEDK